MSKRLLVETLHSTRFLHDVSQEHLEQIANIAHLRDFDEFETVFREGDVAENVYLVVFGNVTLEICAPSVGCRRILTVGPGEILGWSALLEQSRLTATARTTETTRFVELNAALLLTLCEDNPSLGYEIMRRTTLALSKRLSATRMQLLDIYGSQLPAATQVNED